MWNWLRRSPLRNNAETLYAAVMAAARRPGLYLDLGAPDTMEGRFEMLTLHAGPVLRRLEALGKAGDPRSAELSKELADAIFRHLDATLREQGVGDLAVPKRMKKYAGHFYGRLNAYDEALATGDEDALRRALARNALGDPDHVEAAEGLRALLVATRAAMEAAPAAAFFGGEPPFPALAATGELAQPASGA